MSTLNLSNILLEVKDQIAVVTINRPRQMNALNSETIGELGQVFDYIASQDEILSVIIIGAGGKAFVAGADIAELSQKNPDTGKEFALFGQDVFNKIEQMSVPVIAAINGFALGGGCELAMACHIRIAAYHAKFGQPEVGLGLIPGFGGTQRLPRIVGKGRGLELLLGGGMLNAAEAYRIGLVNAVVESYITDDNGKEVLDEKGRKQFNRDAFLDNIIGMAKNMITKGPFALSYVIDAVNRGLETDLQSGLKIEAELFGKLYNKEDTYEGLNAFLEKRKAEFKHK